MHKLTELGLLDELAQAPWYADGLNDKDLALFSTLGSVRGNSRLLYDALVDSYDAKSRSIFLPLAGEVRLWAFDPIEFREGEDPLLQMEDVARVIEAFMAEPFPATDVIMVTSYDTRFGGGAWHAGQYIFVARWGQVPLWAPTVYHEVAHYYFGGSIGPSWLVEGAQLSLRRSRETLSVWKVSRSAGAMPGGTWNGSATPTTYATSKSSTRGKPARTRDLTLADTAWVRTS